MNDYEAKQEAMKARYEALARASEHESERMYAHVGELDRFTEGGRR